MMIVLAINWWSLVIRGLVAILLGLITFVWPGITLGALVLLFGAYALLDGVLAIARGRLLGRTSAGECCSWRGWLGS